jgi:hypothetical protein
MYYAVIAQFNSNTAAEFQRAHMERDNLPPIRELPEEVETLTHDQIEVKSAGW